MLLTIEGVDLPGRTCSGYDDISVGVQRGKDAEQQVPADAPQATWQLALTPKGDADVSGPHVQGRPGARFAYLVWEGRHDDGSVGMFRRIKVPLDVQDGPLREAVLHDRGCTVRIHLTGRDGTPRCGGLRTSDLDWVLDSTGPKTTGK